MNPANLYLKTVVGTKGSLPTLPHPNQTTNSPRSRREMTPGKKKSKTLVPVDTFGGRDKSLGTIHRPRPILRTTIKAQLCGESPKLEVISIAGMGGLGKTTLARNVFDDRLIHDRFDCRAWIILSQDYHLKNILLAIVNSLNINKKELDRAEEGVLREHIYKNLFGRRYLIVMDDVWEAKFWDDIRRIFPDNSNGSRIMITTRLSDVTDYTSSSKFLHQMKFLDDQSWTLLRKKVFAPEHFPNELEVIGKLIAKKCGLPLAIVVIAGVLSNVKRAQQDWENIVRKVGSTAIDHNDKHLSTILSLSYNHLAHYLKPCFLYLGGYPEDYEIQISKLIRLWVAEGFLKPNEFKSLEEVGEEYFRELVNRNLVLITRKKSNGKFKCCIIHDVLRDLCSEKARDENFLLCVQRKNNFQRVPMGDLRRVCIQNLGEYSSILKYIKKHGSHVRSLIYCSPEFCYDDDSLSAVVSGCKLLRILDTRANIRPNFLPIEFELFSGLLPFSADKVRELLYSKMTELLHVRHVLSKRGVALPPIPYEEVRIIDGVPLLGSLQTLSMVTNFKFTRDTIEMIPNLGKLGFRGHALVHGICEDYVLRNLVHFHQLEILYISDFTWDAKLRSPENFAFPSTLIKLTLEGCKLPWKDMSVMGSLPNLQVLKIRSYRFLGEEWEPREGEFLNLKFLKMEGLSGLKYWRAENTHFPRLEYLHILYCDALEEIPPRIGDIPTLQLILLKLGPDDNSALESSALEIQEQQQELGNDVLQVHVVRSLQ